MPGALHNHISGIAASVSRIKYPLTAVGSPLFVPGRFGNALNPNSGGFVYTQPFTAGGSIGSSIFCVDLWAKYTGTTGSYRSLFSLVGASGVQQFSIGMSSSGKLAGQIGTLNWNYGSNVISDGAWYHIASQLVNGKWRFYLNGNQVMYDGGSSSVPTGNGGFNIGYNGIASNTWIGLIDEVRISKIERFPLGTAFTPPTNPYGEDPGLTALYHFESDGKDG